MYNYIIYSLNFKLETEIDILEKQYFKIWVVLEDNYWSQINKISLEKKIYHDKLFTIKEFLAIKFEIFWYYDDIEYKGIPLSKTSIVDEYKKKKNIENLEDLDHDILEKPFHLSLPHLIILYEFLTLNLTALKMYYIPEIKLYIYILYFISWLFILITSVYVFPPTFEYTLIFFNKVLKNLMNENPFNN